MDVEEEPVVIYCDECEDQIEGTQYYTFDVTSTIMCEACWEALPDDGPIETAEDEMEELVEALLALTSG